MFYLSPRLKSLRIGSTLRLEVYFDGIWLKVGVNCKVC